MGVGTTSFLLELEDSCPPHTSTCTIAGMATVALLWDPCPPYLSGFESYNIFFEFPMSLALIKLQKPCVPVDLESSEKQGVRRIWRSPVNVKLQSCLRPKYNFKYQWFSNIGIT